MDSASAAIENLWRSTNEDFWDESLRYYWEYIRNDLPHNFHLEREMNELTPDKIERLDSVAWYAFLRDKYFRWKYTQPNRYATTTASLERYVKEDGLDELLAVKRKLLDLNPLEIEGALRTAKEIHGLGIAGASGLLALLYPRSFGTVDQFVVKALRSIPDLPERASLEKMNASGLSLKNGVLLVDVMRRKAGELNTLFGGNRWTPRKIDMVLWVLRD